ncbi:hypothetical protein JHL18_19640 [Clostridium sp. YIM B02505]|uniref:Uncharacterized protein n=1 Tax=Clostridium yunnanense TaxID=2800325 RepID=A0ABS1EU53_9CLOT|nr:hypothetical protein [Clostridium yunnanense]MBK1812838.1 hypothetical protein [Clostridium yunnanense]
MADEKKVERIISVSKVRVIQKDYKFRNLLSKKKKQWHNKDGKAAEDKDEEDYMAHKSYVEEVKTVLMYGDVGHGLILDKKV